MPYIKPDKRAKVDESINIFLDNIPLDFYDDNGTIQSGYLNYMITRIVLGLIGRPGYSNYSRVLGVLGDVEHEIRRRLLDKYEDKMITENGDLTELEQKSNV